MTVPYWVADAIFYQVFPDRFANGDRENDPLNVQPWGAPPTDQGFQGGDLRGLIRRFDYLLDLGVNALYLNPIFHAASNHRYDTIDYYRIDPRLGDLRDFHALVQLAHRNGVRVILDGVFNHCGRGFFAFNNLLENEEQSPYRDWFHVRKFPLDAYGPGEAKNYKAWWKLKSMPKFNTENPEVRRYLLGVARYWIEQGADGWRLDVPNEIHDDRFWDAFRKAVKQVNPDAYLLGEIWQVDPSWVGPHRFDGLMNYPLRQALLDFVAHGDLKASAFADTVEGLIQGYPREHAYAHYLPLGTHDTERLITLCGGEVAKVKLAFLFQFAFPGAPAIYYGDEIGMEGGKPPDSRRAFPWQEEAWDQDLRGFVQRLAAQRRRLPVLRRGDFRRLLTDDGAGTCAFTRALGQESLVLVLNASQTSSAVALPVAGLGWPDGTGVLDVLQGVARSVAGGHLELELPPYGGALLMLASGS
jgi:glycosidase